MKYRNLKYLLVGSIIFRLLVAPLVWHPDLRNHMDWGIRFWWYGPKAFYSKNIWSFTWPNQPPGTMYLFAGVRKLFEFVFDIIWQININVGAFPSVIASWSEDYLYQVFLKLPAILSDVGISYLIFKIITAIKKGDKGRKMGYWGSLVFLLNPVVWYNSSVWGQYDSLINFFVLLSFYLLYRKKLFLSIFAFALSIYIKASLLIFVPIYLIYLFKGKFELKKTILSLMLGFTLIVLLTLPFSKGNPITWLYYLYRDKVFTQQLHVITANAFNVWATIAGIHERPDSLPFLGMTYQVWSYILYTLSYLPLLYSIIKKPKLETLIWVLTLTAFSSFILLTNMHERYVFPLFPYFTILVILESKLIFNYIITSSISILNMYNFWFTPKINFIVSFLSYQDRLTPRILGLFMTILFIQLYWEYFRQKSLS